MASSLNLKVVTPKGCAVDEVVTSFIARSEVGEFCILPGHALFLSDISPGRMIFTPRDGSPKTFAIDAGFLEAGPERVQVITDNTVGAADVDLDATKEEISALEAKLSTDALDSGERAVLAAKLAWANARLSVVG